MEKYCLGVQTRLHQTACLTNTRSYWSVESAAAFVYIRTGRFARVEGLDQSRDSVEGLNNTISWRIQELSVDFLKQIIAAAKRSGNLISELAETTDFGYDAQFMVFVRYSATEDYVEEFLLLSTCQTYYKKRNV